MVAQKETFNNQLEAREDHPLLVRREVNLTLSLFRALNWKRLKKSARLKEGRF